MVIEEPSVEEKEKIRTRFQRKLRQKSHYDRMMEIFKSLHVDSKYYEVLFTMSQKMELIDSDEETLSDFVKDNLKYLKEK